MDHKLQVLYISNLCSPKVWEYVFRTSYLKPFYAHQKFHSLLATGIGSLTSCCQIQTLSSIPVVYKNHKKRFFSVSSHTKDQISFRYIPLVNLKLIKQGMLFVYTLFFVFRWGLKNKRKKSIVICDILNFSISRAAMLGCKLSNTKTVAIVTDLPEALLNSKKSITKANNLFSHYEKIGLYNFDSYIFLTKEMNTVLNHKNRPYIIMEGLVDKNMSVAPNSLANKSEEQIIHYAGGLYEMYGIKELIEGFMMLKSPHVRLHLFGYGDMANQIKAYCKIDSRISYFGVVPNKVVIADQIKASLLVNPRPSNLELAKFSFPSKNMEYMVSGTPLLTTALPGMPGEYYEHVYIIQNENALGIYQSLNQLLALPKEELHMKGNKAKQFVLEKKSNSVQALRVFNLVMKLLESNQISTNSSV